MNTAPNRRLLEAFSAYESSFGWYCLCLACGHSPVDTHAPLQRLYSAHQSVRAAPDLYPLVSAHWEVVNAALDVGESCTAADPPAAQRRLQSAKAAHRSALLDFRQQLQPLVEACSR